MTLKTNNLIELKKVHDEREADLSSKVRKLKEKYKDTSSLLKKRDDKLRKLESNREALHNELCPCKEMTAANEERLSDELSTIHKIVEVSEEVIECLLKGDELLTFSAKLTRSHANAVTCLTKQLKKLESNNNELVKQFGIVFIHPLTLFQLSTNFFSRSSGRRYCNIKASMAEDFSSRWRHI